MDYNPTNTDFLFCIWFFVKETLNSLTIFEPRHEKTYANNKGADQPAHPCSLISTFVLHCLDSIIPTLAKSKISRL